MRSLYEKLNKLDDSLVESKRIVKKKKLTESLQKKQLKENYQISSETWNNIKNYADLETTTGRDFAYDGPYADEVGSLYGAAIDQYNEDEGTNVEYQASIQNGRGDSELFDDQGGHAYRDFETECDELLDFAREATCLEDFMSSLVSYIYSFAEDLEYEEEDYDDYDDDIDEMLTEEDSAREKLMNTYPDDFGHWEPYNRNTVKPTKVSPKTLDQYARDPETEVVEFDPSSTYSFKELGARQKLRNAFPDLNIPYADSDEHENRPLEEAIKDSDYVIVLTHPNMPQDKRYSYFGSNYRMTRDLNKAMTYPGEFSAKDEIKYALDATDGHWDPSYADRFSVMTIAQVKELLNAPKPEKVSRAVHHNPSAQAAAKPIAKEIHEVIKNHNVSLSSFLKLITEIIKSEDPSA